VDSLFIKGREKELCFADTAQNLTKEGRSKMDVNFIFKIAAIGIIVAVLNQLLTRSGREEYAMITTLAGLVVVLMMIVPQIGNLFQYIKSIFGL